MSSPPTTLGQYQIIREIARSNDIVYEAYDRRVGRSVALIPTVFPDDRGGMLVGGPLGGFVRFEMCSSSAKASRRRWSEERCPPSPPMSARAAR